MPVLEDDTKVTIDFKMKLMANLVAMLIIEKPCLSTIEVDAGNLNVFFVGISYVQKLHDPFSPFYFRGRPMKEGESS